MTLFSGNAKARLEYMNDLALQSALESRALAAIQLNARTGQTVTPLTDLRGLDEKYADVELLKVRVRADLLTITDAVNASAILSNLGPVELRYVAQNFDEMAKEIRPKYKMGILQQQFMIFLRSYIAADNLAPVAGRPVSAADLHASSELAPTRNQINRMGQLIQDTADAHVPAARRTPTQAESIAEAESLGIPTRRPGADGLTRTRLATSILILNIGV